MPYTLGGRTPYTDGEFSMLGIPFFDINTSGSGVVTYDAETDQFITRTDRYDFFSSSGSSMGYVDTNGFNGVGSQLTGFTASQIPVIDINSKTSGTLNNSRLPATLKSNDFRSKNGSADMVFSANESDASNPLILRTNGNLDVSGEITLDKINFNTLSSGDWAKLYTEGTTDDENFEEDGHRLVLELGDDEVDPAEFIIRRHYDSAVLFTVEGDGVVSASGSLNAPIINATIGVIGTLTASTKLLTNLIEAQSGSTITIADAIISPEIRNPIYKSDTHTFYNTAGDSTYATLGSSGLTLGVVNATTLIGAGSAITGLNATNIASGTISPDRLPSTVSVSTLIGDGSGITGLNATNIASGTISADRLPTTINTSKIIVGVADNDINALYALQLNGSIRMNGASLGEGEFVNTPTFTRIINQDIQLAGSTFFKTQDGNSTLMSVGSAVTIETPLYVKGKLGVVTTTPYAKFHIRDTDNLDPTDAATISNYQFMLESSTGGNVEKQVGMGFIMFSGTPDGNDTPGAAITHERTGAFSKGKLHFKTKTNQTDGGVCDTHMTISDDGNVGIGQTNPTAYKLDVNGSQRNLGSLLLSNFNQQTEAHFTTGNNGNILSIEAFNYGNTAKKPICLNSYGGNVGIGKTNPLARLEVAPGTNSTNVAFQRYFKHSIDLTTSTISDGNISIFADDDIVSKEFIVSHNGTMIASDERIKENIEDISDTEALDTLRLLKPKTYTYKDTIGRGTEKVIGFIAQEVEEVLPLATGRRYDTIPNIYELANVSQSNVITFTNFNTSNLTANTMIDTKTETSGNMRLTIEEIIDEHSIKVKEDIDGEQVFIMGEYVDDFTFLKKDHIWTVATSALQEVDRQQQADKERIATLEGLVQTLMEEVAELKSQHITNALQR